jgi:hypothetical protein
MFCAPRLNFGCAECVGSRFHVLPRCRFRRYGGCRVPLSCFACLDSFSAVPRASSPVFMFCPPGLVFGGTEGIGSFFLVLRSQTYFRQFRGRRVPFISFAHPYSFSAVPRASGPVFMFCAPGHVFDGAECVACCFHVLCALTRFRRSRLHVLGVGIIFWRYRGRRIPFSCFALQDMFSTVRRASGPVFGGTEGVGSRFHVLRAQNRFRRYRGRRVPISHFMHSDSFSAVPRASGPVFLFCAPENVFAGTEGVGSRFHVLRARAHFRRYRGRPVSISYFALSDSFSTVPRASCPIFMFCAPGLLFSASEGVRYLLQVLRSWTHFLRYRARRLSFSCFAPRLIFGGTEGVGSRFHALRARTRFRRKQGCWVPFSSFALLESFPAVPRASSPIFKLCVPGLGFGGTECIRSRFLVSRTRTSFQRYGGRPDCFRQYRGRRVPFSCFARRD